MNSTWMQLKPEKSVNKITWNLLWNINEQNCVIFADSAGIKVYLHISIICTFQYLKISLQNNKPNVNKVLKNIKNEMSKRQIICTVYVDKTKNLASSLTSTRPYNTSYPVVLSNTLLEKKTFTIGITIQTKSWPVHSYVQIIIHFS